MYYVLVIIIFTIVSIWSFYLRIQKLRHIPDNLETKPSILSLAVQEVIGIAGGIYLSLVMLISFLKLNIPEKVMYRELAIDPLAGTAIFLTIIQPILTKIINNLKKE